MVTFWNSRLNRMISALLLVCMAAINVPAAAITTEKAPEDALKQIEYEYYFRGKYDGAITALQTFLARTDLSRELQVSAREFLAASYILSGKTDKGKEQFLRLLNDDERYAGPDPSRFKTEVVEAFDSTRDAYAAVKLRSAPAGGDGTLADVATETSKPVYKKWWFYVGLVAALVVIAAVTSPAEEEAEEPLAPTGTVSVGVRLR
jgi:hypothetical protein